MHYIFNQYTLTLCKGAHSPLQKKLSSSRPQTEKSSVSTFLNSFDARNCKNEMNILPTPPIRSCNSVGCCIGCSVLFTLEVFFSSMRFSQYAVLTHCCGLCVKWFSPCKMRRRHRCFFSKQLFENAPNLLPHSTQKYISSARPKTKCIKSNKNSYIAV